MFEKQQNNNWRSTEHINTDVLSFCFSISFDWIISFGYSSSFLSYRISAEVPVHKADPLLNPWLEFSDGLVLNLIVLLVKCLFELTKLKLVVHFTKWF